MNDGRECSHKPRVLVICPKYFPIADGLGHYTTEFCRHLDRVLDVAVWTSKHRGSVERASGSAPERVAVIATVEHWSWGGPFLSLRNALRFEPDKILIEFVPFMYAPRGGINFGLVALGAVLAFRSRVRGKGDVQVMFHELWYPFAWKPKPFVLHLAHRLMVFGLATLSHEIFCSTTRFASGVRETLGPWRRPIHVLPVGSALERDTESPRPEPTHGRVLKLALFGPLHESKNVRLVLQAIRDAQRSSPWEIQLTIIGPTLDELRAAMPDLGQWLDSSVQVEPRLAPEQAAACLASQDFFVAYFQDGVSTRRTTLMAALCEGLPVVTTWRDVSDDVFLQRPFLKLLSPDEETFRNELVAFLSSSERPFSGVSRDEVRGFYRRHFSWSSIVRRYVEASGLRNVEGPSSHVSLSTPPSLRPEER